MAMVAPNRVRAAAAADRPAANPQEGRRDRRPPAQLSAGRRRLPYLRRILDERRGAGRWSSSLKIVPPSDLEGQQWGGSLTDLGQGAGEGAHANFGWATGSRRSVELELEGRPPAGS
ncbi:unnamed protein product [Urochloa humidicola]